MSKTKGLPTDYQKDKGDIFYTYLHIDPISLQCMYVGMGQGQRAWMMRTSYSDSPQYGHRCHEHYEWFKGLEAKGYTLDQIVSITRRGLARDDAMSVEKLDIRDCKPVFNKVQGKALCILSQEQLQDAVKMREDGMFYINIGKELGVSTMTIWRALNGVTKNYVL